MKKYLSLICIAVMQVACGTMNSDSANEKFADAPTYELKAEKFKVDEFVNPGFLVKTDDYLIFFGESSTKRDLFHVYSIDEMKFLYSFGKNGRANNEFLLTSPIYNLQGNTFMVMDCISRKLFEFELTRQGEQLQNITKLDIPIGQPIQEAVMINDSICVFNLMSESESSLYTYNIDSNYVVDKLDLSEQLREQVNADTSLSGFTIGGVGDNDIYIAYCNMDHVSKVGFNSDYTLKKSEYKLQRREINSLDGDLMYYGFVRYDNQYTFAVRNCIKTKSMLNPFLNSSFEVELYDRELQPLALLKFEEKNILRFEVDLEATYLWAWDIIDGFDYIYRYDVSEVLQRSLE